MPLDIPCFPQPPASHLGVLDEATCPSLRDAASKLANRKQVLDDLCRDNEDRWLVPDVLPAGPGSSLDSFGFLSVVLPFLDLTPREHELPARIPTDLAVGEGGRGHFKTHDRALLASLCHDDRAFRDEKDTATALWIRPLSLFMVHEGRSRVRFLRSMGAATMPAAVTPIDYPAANRLTMYRVEVAGRELVWLVLDDQYLRELRYPALSVPFLRAYGVCSSSEWPTHWPDPMSILEEMERMPAWAVRSKAVDLSAVKQRQSQEAQPCATSLSETPVARLRSAHAVLTLAVLMGLGAGLAFLAETPSQAAFGSASAVLASAIVFYCAPLLCVAYRHARFDSRASAR